MKLGMACFFFKFQDVVEGNYKLNMAFVANLFNMYPGLNEEEEETPPEEVITETREEKSW